MYFGVAYIGSGTPNITATAANGTYPCTVLAVSSPQAYLPLVPTFDVNVSGASQVVNVTFQIAYTAWFNETGMPILPNAQSAWGVFFIAGPLYVGSSFGGESADLSYPMFNGTYTFTVYGGVDDGQYFDQYVSTAANYTYTVNGSNVSTSVHLIPDPNASLTFWEASLPTSADWGANLSIGAQQVDNLTWTPGSCDSPPNPCETLTTSVVAADYNFTAFAPAGYVVSPSSGTVDMHWGRNYGVELTFQPSLSTVWFNETGLPMGTPWSLTLDGSLLSGNGSSLTATVTNLTNTFAVTPIPGYSASPSSNTFDVAGSVTTIGIRFSPFTYPVTFNESGLPFGTTWWVDMNGVRTTSTSDEIVVDLPNGTYTFDVGGSPGYLPAPYNSTLVVLGAPEQKIVSFQPVEYDLLFREAGLPNGTGWVVAVGSQVQSSLNDTVTFLEPNGTYSYVILSVSGYKSSASGLVTINGNTTAVAVTFDPITYPVTIIEFGLPAGTVWSVTVWSTLTGFNETLSTNSSIVIFFLSNGTYKLSVNVSGSFNVTLTSGQFTVAGQSPSSPTAYISPLRTSGSTGQTTTLWAEIGIGLGGAGLVVAAVVLLRRRRGPAKVESDTSGTPQSEAPAQD